jgi:hypothetical protein
MAAPIGYVLNLSGQFGTMDLATGNFVMIGAGLPNVPDGLAGAPGGPFYTVDGITGHLLSISRQGVVTDVGDTGTGPNNGPTGVSVVGGLTNGALFALDFANRLFSINAATGGLTLLGSLPLPTQDDAYIGNMFTSLNGDGQFLYYTLFIETGPNATGPTLFQINPGTLQVASTGLTGVPATILGSGFIDGSYYAFTAAGDILLINPATGVGSVVGSYDSGTPPGGGPPFTGVYGIVATPEPGAVWLSALGIAAILARRRF